MINKPIIVFKMFSFNFVLFHVSASPRSFDFTSEVEPNTGDLLLTCNAKGVYPVPRLSLSRQVLQADHKTSFILINVNQSIEKNVNSSLYNISIKYIASKLNFTQSIISRSQTLYQCKLELKKVGYREKRRLILYSSKSTFVDPFKSIVGHLWFCNV